MNISSLDNDEKIYLLNDVLSSMDKILKSLDDIVLDQRHSVIKNQITILNEKISLTKAQELDIIYKVLTPFASKCFNKKPQSSFSYAIYILFTEVEPFIQLRKDVLLDLSNQGNITLPCQDNSKELKDLQVSLALYIHGENFNYTADQHFLGKI